MPLEEGLLELALLGLEGLVLLLELPLVVLLELDVLPCDDEPPWLRLKSCHGTGHSLPSAVITAKSTLPLVGFSTTSSMRPTSSPDVVFTCAPISFEPRRCCCMPAVPLPRPVALKIDELDWLD